ncbi:MAG TPA: sulfatase [Cyclobacteriaceae bacterium]|nr:sulfatase [Cyclobacteriaceae bacterium]
MRYLFLLLILYLPFSAASQQKPNIILIVSDDHSYQTISAYGSKFTQTPHIDRIASEGVLFNQAYVTNSICGPSRAVILTGKHSHKNGFKDNETSDFDASQDLFVKRLQQDGYQTAWIGKYHLGDKPEGFDYWEILPGQGSYFNPDFITMDGSTKRYEGYVSDIVEDVAERWLDQRDRNKPFCLIIGHKAIHRTWMPDLNDLGMFDDVVFPIPSTFYDDYKSRKAAAIQDMSIAETMQLAYDLKMYPNDCKDHNIKRMNEAQILAYRKYYNPIKADLEARQLTGKSLTEWKFQRYMRDYLATAASLDRNIGRALKYLDQYGLTDHTAVIYMSDQGFYMGEHGWFDKRFMYEESFRTPMVMRYPGVIRAGTVSDDMVMNLDIAPTILDIAGVAIPEDMQGESFLPLLTAKKAKGRSAIYYHYYENGEHAVSPHFGVKTERYKLIRYYKRVEAWELYDLEKDPHELNNLYGNSKYRKTQEALKKQLQALIDQYEDEDARTVITQNI